LNKIVNCLDTNRDTALLFVRIGIGLMFIFVHGGPKILGGPEGWDKIGGMIGVLGITFYPTALGFIASLFELLGGIFIALGLFTRLGAAMILSTLIVAAATMYVAKGLFAASPAIEDSLFMILLIFLGGGKYSIEHKLCKK